MQEKLKRSINFCEFIAEMKESIEEHMGKEFLISMHTVTRNNGGRREGITIGKKLNDISCTIYLENYYTRYLNGTPFSMMVNEIEDSYFKLNKTNLPDTEYLKDYEKIKNNIFYRLVNMDKNKELLEDIPYLPFLDLAITFHCLVRNSKEHMESVRITKTLLKLWGINTKTLTERAKANTPHLFPIKINTMDEIILGFLGEAASVIDGVRAQKSLMQMYVITNTLGINGASCLLYEDAVQHLGDMLKGDLYILPSSIHEIIAVKDDGVIEKHELANMVKEVNITQVAEEDYLSDSVYFYCRESRSIKKA